MCAHKNRKVRVIMDTQQIIETAEEKLIHTYNRYQIVLDKGDGVRLYDTDGKEYLDFGAGIAVFALGYNNKEYNDALKAQIDKLIHTSNYFYNIGGNILKKHNLNNANNGFNYDVSLERQRDCLQILIDDIKQLVEVCKKYGRPMPTEIKMVYDVKTKQFNADYKYNLVHSNHKTKTADDIVNDWYYEVKNKRNSSL